VDVDIDVGLAVDVAELIEETLLNIRDSFRQFSKQNITSFFCFLHQLTNPNSSQTPENQQTQNTEFQKRLYCRGATTKQHLGITGCDNKVDPYHEIDVVLQALPCCDLLMWIQQTLFFLFIPMNNMSINSICLNRMTNSLSFLIQRIKGLEHNMMKSIQWMLKEDRVNSNKQSGAALAEFILSRIGFPRKNVENPNSKNLNTRSLNGEDEAAPQKEARDKR